MENIEHRVAILVYLPEEISFVIKNVKEETQTFYPNHETQTPHMTIYSCRFDESKVPELITQIKNLNIKPFSVKLGELVFSELNKGNDNLFAALYFEDESGLRKLHEEIFPIANKLRDNLIRSKDVVRYEKGIYSKELFSFIEKYGYEHVKEHFHPHITIGGVEGDNTEKIEQLKKLLKPLTGKEFVIDKINLLLSTRMLPSEEKVKESESFEIALKS